MELIETVEWPDVKDAKLGRSFDSKTLKEFCTGIYGGISWPGKFSASAVVVALNEVKSLGRCRNEACILDEVESRDILELIELCNGLHEKHNPSVWIGDNRNPTADKFIRQESVESKFTVIRASILDMASPYQYMLQSIRSMLRENNRTLFLKNSGVKEYLRQVEPDREWEYSIGEFPAIEALAFAVLEGGKHTGGVTLKQIRQWQRKYLGID